MRCWSPVAAAVAVSLGFTAAIGAADMAIAAAVKSKNENRLTVEMLAAMKKFGEAKKPENVISWGEKLLGISQQVRVWQSEELSRVTFEFIIRHFTAEAYLDKGSASSSENRERAITLLESAIANIDQVKADVTLVANAFGNLGAAYAGSGDSVWPGREERAIAVLSKAIQLHQSAGDAKRFAFDHMNLATAYIRRLGGDSKGNATLAASHIETALKLLSFKDEPREWTHATRTLADLYRTRGSTLDESERALVLYQKLDAVLDRKIHRVEVAWVRFWIGTLYTHRNVGSFPTNIDKAIGSLNRALSIIDRRTDQELWIALQFALGQAYAGLSAKGSTSAANVALSHYQRVSRALPQDADYIMRARLNLALGMLHHRGNPTPGRRSKSILTAIDYFEKALATLPESDRSAERFDILNSLASCYFDLLEGKREKNLERAAYYMQQLADIADDAKPSENTRAKFARGVVALINGSPQQAVGEFYAMATEVYRQETQALRDEFSWRGSGIKDLFVWASYAALKYGDARAAFKLADQGRSRSLAAAISLEGLAIPDDVRLELERLRAEIRTLDQMHHADFAGNFLVGQLGAEVRELMSSQLRQEREKLTQLISQNSQFDPFGRQTPIEQLLLDALSTADAVAMPIVTELGSMLLLAKAKPAGEGSLQRGVEYYSANLPHLDSNSLFELSHGNPDGPARTGWSSVFGRLRSGARPGTKEWTDVVSRIDRLSVRTWELIGGSLVVSLQKFGIPLGSRVVWIPQGPLGAIPIASASETVLGEPVLDSYQFVYAPSLTAVSWIIRRPRDGRLDSSMMAIVNPSADAKLQYADLEGSLVASQFPQESRVLLRSADASRDAIFSAMKNSAYWHFATHGSFDSIDVRRSGVQLAGDDRLTLDDLLGRRGLGQPRLVVLSACETALYDLAMAPEEFTGLPLAFLQVGASGVIASLWRVPDLSTTLLMTRFYEVHRVHGASPGDALRAAQTWLRQASRQDLQNYIAAKAASGQLDLIAKAKAEFETGPRSERPYASPYYWAAFVHYGL